MLNGIRFPAYPKEELRQTLARWEGCSRFIWNAKTEEDKYLRAIARKWLPVGTFPKPDQTYSQYKHHELTPWLSKCPSQVLRNSAANWYKTYQNYLGGRCGRPRKKRKGGRGSIHLTRELFEFEKVAGRLRLRIGTKKNPVGYLPFKAHRKFSLPNSIYIVRENGYYFISFCYEDPSLQLPVEQMDLQYLQGCSQEELEEMTVGIDRGVVRPVQLSNGACFSLAERTKNKAKGRERYIRRMQKANFRGNKDSKRRRKKLNIIAKRKQKSANMRKDFNHKATHAIVNDPKIKIIVLEDLKLKQMTKRAKPQKDASGHWKKNGRKAKSGLNAAMLNIGSNQFETYLSYKAKRIGKLIVKVSPQNSSLECADCEHIHPDNRKDQKTFLCVSCGHLENADINASKVVKKRAIKLILYPGTGLSSRGVLVDIGRGAKRKTSAGDSPSGAVGCEASKKTA